MFFALCLVCLTLLPQGHKLNAALPSSGDVRDFASSPDARRVAYLADRDADERVELYGVSANGGASVRLNGALVANGDVTDFAFTPDSAAVVYLADQEVDEQFELWRVPAVGGAAVRLTALGASGKVYSFALSPDGAFAVYRALDPALDPTIQLYAVTLPSGGIPLQLTAYPEVFPGLYPSSFTIAPDSSRVVFQLEEFNVLPAFPDPYVDLFSVPIAGGPVVQLCAAQRYCLSYHVTPDSSRVVFTADVDVLKQFELYSVPLAGGAAVKLNPQLGGGSVGTVTWCPFASCAGAPPSFYDDWMRISPDSLRVAFTARESNGSLTALYSAPLAGGPATLLAAPSAGLGLPDAFGISADSTRVAYLARTSAVSNSLHSVPLTGGASVLLSGALASGGSVVAHVESPDSSRVVFVADKDANDVFELYSVPFGGGAASKLNPPLAPNTGVTSFGLALSPDARSVVYLLDVPGVTGNELFRVATDGSQAARVLDDGLVAGGSVLGWSLSSDSRYAFYLADQDRDDVNELYASLLTRSARRAP